MAQLLAMVSILILPKHLEKTLTFGLSHKEFQCRCNRSTCHFTLVAQSLLDSYWSVRYRMGMPLDINSGHRCQLHNKDRKVMGSDTSSHTTGHAIDISTENMSDADKIRLIKIAKENFDIVIIYKDFIHCHNEGE